MWPGWRLTGSGSEPREKPDPDPDLRKSRQKIRSEKVKKIHFPGFVIIMHKCLIELLIEKIISKVKVFLLFILRSWSFFFRRPNPDTIPFVIQRPSLITVYIDLVWVNAYVEGGGEGEKDVGELDDQPAPQRRVLHLPVHNHLDRVDRWSRFSQFNLLYNVQKRFKKKLYGHNISRIRVFQGVGSA